MRRFFFPLGPEYHRGLYAGITLCLIFITYPASQRKLTNHPSVLDICFVILSILCCGYWITEFEALNFRAGAETQLDYFISLVGIPLGLEAARRVLGWPLPIIALVAIAFGVFGQYLPEPFEHAGFSLREIAVYLFLSNNGFFGLMTNILATFVILFIFFGAILDSIGASRLFIDLPMAMVGHKPGGPAKVAVLASALFGSISGSAIANTVSTGTFTIPLMKKSGFPPHVAGAIEPSASIGGMFLPPVMGAGGFIMAELTGIAYSKIMLYSLLPALIYFLSVIMLIHFEAGKQNLGITDRPKNLRTPAAILKSEGYLLMPLLTIAVLLLIGYSPGFSASAGIVLMLGIGIIQKRERRSPSQLWLASTKGVSNTLVIGATIGVIGVVIGIIELTGIGLQISSIFISAAQSFHLPDDILTSAPAVKATINQFSQVFLTIILTAIASLILGMGAPVTAAYLITVILVGPALADMGISIIAAHMIVYWLSQDSNITPPVCVAAYAGAAIAKADPWKTGWTAFKYSKMLYLMPILFAFHPAALMKGSTTNNLTFWLIMPLATLLFAAILQGFYIRRLKLWERGIGLILLITMLTTFDMARITAATIFLGLLLCIQIKSRKSLQHPLKVNPEEIPANQLP